MLGLSHFKTEYLEAAVERNKYNRARASSINAALERDKLLVAAGLNAVVERDKDILFEGGV
jgi:hypothetical protein